MALDNMVLYITGSSNIQ